jgi:hypothetical protein
MLNACRSLRLSALLASCNRFWWHTDIIYGDSLLKTPYIHCIYGQPYITYYKISHGANNHKSVYGFCRVGSNLFMWYVHGSLAGKSPITRHIHTTQASFAFYCICKVLISCMVHMQGPAQLCGVYVRCICKVLLNCVVFMYGAYVRSCSTVWCLCPVHMQGPAQLCGVYVRCICNVLINWSIRKVLVNIYAHPLFFCRAVKQHTHTPADFL